MIRLVFLPLVLATIHVHADDAGAVHDADAVERVRLIDRQPALPIAAVKDRLEPTLLRMNGVVSFTMRDRAWVIGTGTSQAQSRVEKLFADVLTIQNIPLVVERVTTEFTAGSAALDDMTPEQIVAELHQTLIKFEGVTSVRLGQSTDQRARVRIGVVDQKTERAMNQLFPPRRLLGGLPVVVRIDPAPEPARSAEWSGTTEEAYARCESRLGRARRHLRAWFNPPVPSE